MQSKPSLGLAVMAAARLHPRHSGVQAAACGALANLAKDGRRNYSDGTVHAAGKSLHWQGASTSWRRLAYRSIARVAALLMSAPYKAHEIVLLAGYGPDVVVQQAACHAIASFAASGTLKRRNAFIRVTATLLAKTRGSVDRRA